METLNAYGGATAVIADWLVPTSRQLVITQGRLFQ